ncbi:MAG: DUF624 domain-containing protein [Lachnospiraceae bacterium]|nr:DUF624 domain-containing protein [Lachnospiraceae bacterium]
MKLFAFDSPVMQAISTATDYAILNILWIICSLPLFTAGAAMSAKYYVGMKLYKGESPAVFKSFFSSFASNLKQTIPISVASALAMAGLGADWYLLIKHEVPAFLKWGLFIVSLLFLMMLFCLFPMIARYEIRTRDAIKTALGMAGARFPRVFLAIFCFILPFFIGIWYFKWAWLICLGAQTVMLYYNSGFFAKEFEKLEDRLHAQEDVQKETELEPENEEDDKTDEGV